MSAHKHQGLLIIDHRGGENPDGTPGILVETATVGCAHCQAVIARYLPEFADRAKNHVANYRCVRCDKNICKACAARMEKTGLCNPIDARIEHALKVGGWDENYQHNFKILPN
jgi:hypothetical protein